MNTMTNPANTAHLSAVSMVSFFGLLFVLFIPFQTPQFGYLPGIVYFSAFLFTAWLFHKRRPKYKVFFALFVVLTIFKAVALIVGNDYHIQ